eukprot:gene30132-37628_t
MIADYKMKWLSKNYRQLQGEMIGQAGISIHIIYYLGTTPDGELIILLLDRSKEFGEVETLGGISRWSHRLYEDTGEDVLASNAFDYVASTSSSHPRPPTQVHFTEQPALLLLAYQNPYGWNSNNSMIAWNIGRNNKSSKGVQYNHGENSSSNNTCVNGMTNYDHCNPSYGSSQNCICKR